MIRIRSASTPVPLLAEGLERHRLDLDDRPVVAILARLSRGLSVLALVGCAGLALVAVQGAGKAARNPVATRPVVEQIRPALGSTASAAAPDVRLVYGNPDELRGANRQPDATLREALAPNAAAPQEATPSAAHPAIVEAAEAAPVRTSAAVNAEPVSLGTAGSVSDGVDLNTASVERLNALDAGMIGRTIVRGRPYGSPEDLVQRRILNRADFAKIKDRVVVGSVER